ncbi:GNAT family N-acetyltransferase [Acinetobacter boissieri]|uniref:N-acetyltransferase domain-containing protein n=1 Tax=Acinetobacter boissieri TaxID=1219383 RepID=A0A1G6HFM6_9GAMM|nr:GNAT family N-acetyltransferase [Acinetobacter boissieri]SDB93040.1 hypothetical protein SAMN05421733_105152 [Acinetobacter boissieri]
MQYLIYNRREKLDHQFESRLVIYLHFNQLEHLNHQDSSFVIATHVEHIVGIGVIYTNDFHPSNHYFYIHVFDSFQRKGIGSKILKILESMQGITTLQCLINSKNTIANRFLLNHHFYLARKTSDFELNTLPKKTMLYTTKSVNKLSHCELKKIKRIFYFNYLDHHESVNPLNPKLDQNTFFESIEKTLDLDKSEVLVRTQPNMNDSGSQAVIAYIFFGDSVEQSLEVAYVGGEFQAEVNEYCHFFCSVMNIYLNKNNTLYFESDNTDFYMNNLVKYLNIKPCQQYNTYIKKV